MRFDAHSLAMTAKANRNGFPLLGEWYKDLLCEVRGYGVAGAP
jgi:hypothetical protein